MQDNQKQVLDIAADRVVSIVAKTFVDGGGDKTAKSRIKEELRQVWHAGRISRSHKICGRLRVLATELREDKI